MTRVKDLHTTWLFWFSVFSVLFGSLSLISIIIRLTEVGLHGILQDLLLWYQGGVEILQRALDKFLNLRLPVILLDFLLLYFLMVGIGFRTLQIDANYERQYIKDHIKPHGKWHPGVPRFLERLNLSLKLVPMRSISRINAYIASREDALSQYPASDTYKHKREPHIDGIKHQKNVRFILLMQMLGIPIFIIVFFVWNSLLSI